MRRQLIDVCLSLKVILRDSVGLDTIDHEYARSKGKSGMITPLGQRAAAQNLLEV